MPKRNRKSNDSSSTPRWSFPPSTPRTPSKSQPTFKFVKTKTKPRLPVIAPSFEPAEPKIESEPFSSPQEVIDVRPPLPQTARVNHSRFKGVAISLSFAVVLGGFVWVFASQNPGSEKPPETGTKIVDSQAPPSLTTSTINPVPVSYTHLTLPTIYSV